MICLVIYQTEKLRDICSDNSQGREAIVLHGFTMNHTRFSNQGCIHSRNSCLRRGMIPIVRADRSTSEDHHHLKRVSQTRNLSHKDLLRIHLVTTGETLLEAILKPESCTLKPFEQSHPSSTTTTVRTNLQSVNSINQQHYMWNPRDSLNQITSLQWWPRIRRSTAHKTIVQSWMGLKSCERAGQWARIRPHLSQTITRSHRLPLLNSRFMPSKTGTQSKVRHPCSVIARARHSLGGSPLIAMRWVRGILWSAWAP